MIQLKTKVTPKIVVLDNQGRYVNLFLHAIDYYYSTDDGKGVVVGTSNKDFVFLVTVAQFEKLVRDANTIRYSLCGF